MYLPQNSLFLGKMEQLNKYLVYPSQKSRNLSRKRYVKRDVKSQFCSKNSYRPL